MSIVAILALLLAQDQAAPPIGPRTVIWDAPAAQAPRTPPQNGVAAYAKGDYATAARLYKLAAGQGDALAQNNLGVMYYNGTGVPQDYILAHMWSNLAASSPEDPDGGIATTNRDSLAAGKMTPAQISRAQSMARVCQASNFKTCGY